MALTATTTTELGVNSRGQHEWCIWVPRPHPRGAPPQGVDISNVVCEVVEGRVLLHGPDLGRAVVRAGGEECPTAVPLHAVDAVLRGEGGETMQLQPAHMGEELCSLSQLALHEGRMGQCVCALYMNLRVLAWFCLVCAFTYACGCVM